MDSDPNSFFSLIFLGDTHGFLNDFEKQKEIIEKTNPEFILCEGLENISLISEEDFQNILDSKKISNMTSFEELKDLIELCNDNGINLIGIDLENLGFDENLQNKIKNQINVNENEEKQLEEILKKRENKHIDLITEYLQKTSKPLLVIIGAWHLREGSKLMNSFDKYKLIYPCDEEGNPVLEPNENKKISYREKIKWLK